MTDEPAPPDKSLPDAAEPPAPASQSGGTWRAFMRSVGELAREAGDVLRGRPREDEPPESADDAALAADEDEHNQQTRWKIDMLHSAAERLRGAADSYIAAKLDEIEARVDAKLDEIEQRIDHKMLELHRQLRQARDRELRHRLRLLKITLVFTVLVAALSLGYKLLVKYWVG